MKQFNKVQQSGNETDFGTGAVRDDRQGKGRFDLMPILFMFRLAKHFENGAARYKERNWEAGIPLSVYWDSCIRHLCKLLLGMEDEDHASAAAWNIACFIETKERIDMNILPKELDDMPDTFNQSEEKLQQLYKWFGIDDVSSSIEQIGTSDVEKNSDDVKPEHTAWE